MKRAAKIAAERHATLSAVVAEALEDGLTTRSRTQRAEQVLAAYRTAFNGFTDQERLLLDDIELEPKVSC